MLTHEPTPFPGTPERGRAVEAGLSRVLVATDFSPPAACALARARLLPLRRGAEFLLVHVLPAGASEGARYDEQEALARHALQETSQLCARAPCEARCLLLRGSPAEAITQAARDFGAELVVMGRPHRPASFLARIRERMAGGLIQGIPSAVLVVGPPPEGPYRRPLVPVDFTEASRHALEAALRLCPNASRVAVLHDYDTSYELVLHQSGASSARILAFQHEAKEQARAELHRFLAPYREAGLQCDELVRSGETRESILELAREEQADLVVVGRHLREGLGRLVRPHVGEQVARESTCDVLILQEEPR